MKMELENMMSKWPTHMEDELLLYIEGPVSLAEGTHLGAAWNVGQSASFGASNLTEGKAKLQCLLLYCLSRETTLLHFTSS